MAVKESHHRHYQAKQIPLFPLLSLICFVSIFLALSVFHKTSVIPRPHQTFQFINGVKSGRSTAAGGDSCDYSDGSWFHDPNLRTSRYDHTCKEIFKGWNCFAANKSNALEITNWHWKPTQCDLPHFDPVSFLEKFRNSNIGTLLISLLSMLQHLSEYCCVLALNYYAVEVLGLYAGFVGDSLNRNMFVSLFCSLKSVAGEVKKWRPAGADRGFSFLKYNLTIAYHRTNILARYGWWSANADGGPLESLGYKGGYRVDVDIPESSWMEAPNFHDVLVFNTGHWWWAPSKFDPVKSPMLFFEKSLPVIPPVPPDVGLDMVLKHMISYVEKRMPRNAIKFFRTQSPRHFEGGDWYQGGSCQRQQPLSPQQAEDLFSLTNNRTNVEVRLVNEHLFKALNGTSFHILNITPMSELRADAHPAAAGGKKHDDCMHWCLPGLTDTWNDLFIKHLYNIRRLRR
ncbi:protein trichome birefringence-like 13 [Cucumis melo var. makuwa]|uniref:Protein trichome birefringence-like 13 n=1 Tax=Cucumis melo var. makuwa TaxID=1194695 RepID=A0A5A7TLB5_CUCMM|nr:protein trichome birefringence-like 13 [Cucumis melo var. makuwa]